MCVAPDIATAEVALFEHGDIGEAVVLREVVGGGEAMAAATDDERVIGRLGIGVAPGGPPATVAGQPFLHDGPCRVAHPACLPVRCAVSAVTHCPDVLLGPLGMAMGVMPGQASMPSPMPKVRTREQIETAKNELRLFVDRANKYNVKPEFRKKRRRFLRYICCRQTIERNRRRLSQRKQCTCRRKQ